MSFAFRGSVLLCAFCACIDTGVDRVRVPFAVAGTETDVIEVEGMDVCLERADLAFGAFYLCAGRTAGALCDSARLEWLDSAVVDLLDPVPQPVGELVGRTGIVRSYMYDYGISSQLTETQAVPLAAAEALGEASVFLEGTVTLEGNVIPFSARVPVSQTDDTELGVPVVRKAASEPFERNITSDEAGLVIRFDVEPWIERAALETLQVGLSCEAGGSFECVDGVATRCEDGQAVDCRTTSDVCDPVSGCVSRIDVSPNSAVRRALRVALLTSGRPSFEWIDGE